MHGGAREFLAVAWRAHLREVEPVNLVRRRYAVADDGVENDEGDGGSEPNPGYVGDDSDARRDELPGVPVEETAHGARNTVEPVAVATVGEEPERNDAPGAVHAVDGDGSDRVVHPERLLDGERGDDDEHSGHRAN